MNQNMESRTHTEPELSGDMLKGAEAIAEFVFGKSGKNGRRKVYYLAETSHLPVFRLGSQLCARRSVLMGWIAGQENRVKDRSGMSPSIGR